jgi:hypothetical protein
MIDLGVREINEYSESKSLIKTASVDLKSVNGAIE